MPLTRIKERAQLLMTPNDLDSSEVYVGYDFAIRPEIIAYLADQLTAGQSSEFNNHLIKSRLSLDEHELAIG